MAEFTLHFLLRTEGAEHIYDIHLPQFWGVGHHSGANPHLLTQTLTIILIQGC